MLERAFPPSIEDNANFVLASMDMRSTLEPSSPFCVVVDNQFLKIPYRIYYKATNLEGNGNRSSLQNEILYCLFTRHHNGYIREKCLIEVISVNLDWIPPYVLRLLGEYVIEILEVIEKNLPKLNTDIYRAFLASNQAFYKKTKQRMISYWDCYYRGRYPDRNKYIGSKIVSFFDGLL